MCCIASGHLLPGILGQMQLMKQCFIFRFSWDLGRNPECGGPIHNSKRLPSSGPGRRLVVQMYDTSSATTQRGYLLRYYSR